MHNPHVIGSPEWLAFRKPSLRISVKSMIVCENRPAITGPDGEPYQFRAELGPISNSLDHIRALKGELPDPTPEQVLFGREVDATLDEIMPPTPPEPRPETPENPPSFGAIFQNNKIA